MDHQEYEEQLQELAANQNEATLELLFFLGELRKPWPADPKRREAFRFLLGLAWAKGWLTLLADPPSSVEPEQRKLAVWFAVSDRGRRSIESWKRRNGLRPKA